MKKGLFLLLLFMTMLISGCRTVVYKESPPPPKPKVEIRGAPPYPGVVWVPGQWCWRGKRYGYVWAPGHWRK